MFVNFKSTGSFADKLARNVRECRLPQTTYHLKKLFNAVFRYSSRFIKWITCRIFQNILKYFLYKIQCHLASLQLKCLRRWLLGKQLWFDFVLNLFFFFLVPFRYFCYILKTPKSKFDVLNFCIYFKWILQSVAPVFQYSAVAFVVCFVRERQLFLCIL